MAENKVVAAPTFAPRDPFALLRQVTAQLDRAFAEPFWPGARWPASRALEGIWAPKIDVFEREGHLVTRIDLPGLRKEDITVELRDGHLVVAGERKIENEVEKENVYRTEREYGTFYRAVPLPEGVKAEQVKATFAEGVLEVTVPLPARVAPAATRIAIEAPGKEVHAAA